MGIIKSYDEPKRINRKGQVENNQLICIKENKSSKIDGNESKYATRCMKNLIYLVHANELVVPHS